jgi:hypothetical protein
MARWESWCISMQARNKLNLEIKEYWRFALLRFFINSLSKRRFDNDYVVIGITTVLSTFLFGEVNEVNKL